MSARTNDLVGRFHRQAMAVTAGLALGVLTFAGVAAWLVARGGYDPVLDGGAGVRVGALALAAVLLGAARPIERRLDRAEPGAPAESIGQSWLSASIVGMALREAVGLLGGVLVLATGDLRAGGALAVAALAVMGLAWPRRAELERRIRKAGG